MLQSDTAEKDIRRFCKWDAQKLVDPAARGTDEGAVVELDSGVHRRGSGEGQRNVSEDEGKLGTNEEDHRGSAAVGSGDREDCVDVNSGLHAHLYARAVASRCLSRQQIRRMRLVDTRGREPRDSAQDSGTCRVRGSAGLVLAEISCDRAWQCEPLPTDASTGPAKVAMNALEVGKRRTRALFRAQRAPASVVHIVLLRLP